ncbi:response regulator transcription factor [Clostridium sp.]|uniref:response regulator transcription factor n=1 Tax=Clostridium sp. TaxID=1506 RepID=UPI002615F075|nr:response regulator transcription factor [Clostridium sp.]
MNILLVDDEEKIVEVIEAYLKKEGFEVFSCSNGKDALNIFNNNKIDLILLDLMLPDLSGEEVCKVIREKSCVPIIMITAKTEEDDLLEGFDIGADDYVTKPFSVKQLIARIKALLRRATNCDKEGEILVFNDGELKINLETREVWVRGKLITLTSTEFNILMCLSKYPKKIFTRDEIIELVLGDKNDSFDRVIDSHIKNLRSKIEENSRKPKFIMTVYGVGYKFEGKKI